MNTLKKLADDKVQELWQKDEEFNWSNYKDNLNDLSDEVQSQRLIIMELEETNGAITQENAWLQEEIDLMKSQIAELECMIYGEKIRYFLSFLFSLIIFVHLHNAHSFLQKISI